MFNLAAFFVEVMKDKVVILADTAERAEELDENKIEAARLRAEEAKKNAKFVDDVEFAKISSKIEKELARLHAVNKWRRLKGNSNK